MNVMLFYASIFTAIYVIVGVFINKCILKVSTLVVRGEQPSKMEKQNQKNTYIRYVNNFLW